MQAKVKAIKTKVTAAQKDVQKQMDKLADSKHPLAKTINTSLAKVQTALTPQETNMAFLMSQDNLTEKKIQAAQKAADKALESCSSEIKIAKAVV